MPDPTDEVPEFAALYAAEERHFWFRGRARVLAGLFRRLTAPLPDGFRVLEVGCGTGNVLRALEPVCARGRLLGLELHPEGAELARRRVRCPVAVGDVRDLAVRERFDLVGAFDVLEHLADDDAVARGLAAALGDGGRLVVTVPAHQWLWSHTDVAAGHYRRYSPAGLRGLLEGAGLRVEYQTQFLAPLVPLMWAGRRVAAVFGGRTGTDVRRSRELALREFRVNPVVNWCLDGLLRFDAAVVARGGRLPLGTSLLAVAGRAAAEPARRAA